MGSCKHWSTTNAKSGKITINNREDRTMANKYRAVNQDRYEGNTCNGPWRDSLKRAYQDAFDLFEEFDIDMVVVDTYGQPYTAEEIN